MATYTDKLFKLRNGRWEDLLSDEVNRDVASRFAGRSVACVDRTVSRQGTAGRGHLHSLPTPCAPPALPCRAPGDLSPCMGTSPIPPPTGAGGVPKQPGTVRAGSPPSRGDCRRLSTRLPPADKRACRGDLCSCHLLFLLPPPPAVCFQMIITKSGSSCCTGQGEWWGWGGPGTLAMLRGQGAPCRHREPGDHRAPETMGHVPAPGVLFTRGFAELLLSMW